MPPRGVKKGSKRERQYEHIKESLEERGDSPQGRGGRCAHGEQGTGEIRGRDEVELAALEA